MVVINHANGVSITIEHRLMAADSGQRVLPAASLHCFHPGLVFSLALFAVVTAVTSFVGDILCDIVTTAANQAGLWHHSIFSVKKVLQKLFNSQI